MLGKIIILFIIDKHVDVMLNCCQIKYISWNDFAFRKVYLERHECHKIKSIISYYIIYIIDLLQTIHTNQIYIFKGSLIIKKYWWYIQIIVLNKHKVWSLVGWGSLQYATLSTKRMKYDVELYQVWTENRRYTAEYLLQQADDSISSPELIVSNSNMNICCKVKHIY